MINPPLTKGQDKNARVGFNSMRPIEKKTQKINYELATNYKAGGTQKRSVAQREGI
jgi:hypothetical protein